MKVSDYLATLSRIMASCDVAGHFFAASFVHGQTTICLVQKAYIIRRKSQVCGGLHKHSRQGTMRMRRAVHVVGACRAGG